MPVPETADVVIVKVFKFTNRTLKQPYPFRINFHASEDDIHALLGAEVYKKMCNEDEIMFLKQGDGSLEIAAKDGSIIDSLQKELDLNYDRESYTDTLEKISHNLATRQAVRS